MSSCTPCLADSQKGFVHSFGTGIGLVTSFVASNPIIADALEGARGDGQHKQNSLVLAIDVARFADPTVFRAEVERLIATVNALPWEPGVAEIAVQASGAITRSSGGIVTGSRSHARRSTSSNA